MARSKSANQGYRRGSVLGLTVAEVSLLFVFIILLMIAGPARREQEMTEMLADFGMTDRDTAQLRSALREQIVHDTVRERVWKELVPASDQRGTASELVIRLSTLAERRSDSLKMVQSSTGEISRLRRQVDGLRREVNLARGGSDFPSCWYDEDGDRVFLFDVAMRDEGYWFQLTRSALEMLPTFSGPDPSGVVGRTLNETEFLDVVLPLYGWSVQHECRFFVNVYDETGQSKDIFKQRLNVLERRFYKRELTGRYPQARPSTRPAG